MTVDDRQYLLAEVGGGYSFHPAVQAFSDIDYNAVGIVLCREGVVGFNVLLGNEGSLAVVMPVPLKGEFFAVRRSRLHVEADGILVRAAGAEHEGAKEEQEHFHNVHDKRFSSPWANQ